MHPIQAREHPLYEYTGAADATRTFAEELSTGEVEARVCALTMLKVGEPHVFDRPVTPFSAEHPVPEVIFLFCFLLPIFVLYCLLSNDLLLLFEGILHFR